jgi:hypothetical protein
MSVKVGWLMNVQVTDGPKLPAAGKLEVDAYDVIRVQVPDGAAAMEVEIQPGSENAVQLLMLHASKFTTDLSYSVNAAKTKATDRFALDGPHLMVGSGAMAMFGAAPASLYFYNSDADPIDMTILVGRDATPPPAPPPTPPPTP